MRNIHFVLAAALVAFAACSQDSRSNDAPTSTPSPTSSASNDRHPDDGIVFGPAPAVFPPGAEMAVLQGDPSKAELFTVRLRLPNGYRLPAHIHPTRENVTVIQGTFLAGMGTQFNESSLQAFGQGAFLSVPENHPHFAAARGLTVVQVHAIGPFALTYVHPTAAR